MSTSEHHWKQSNFVSARYVLQPSRSSHRQSRRLNSILRKDKVKMAAKPITIGENEEKIQIIPIMSDGRISALKVICCCGNESTFDIQYTQGGPTA